MSEALDALVVGAGPVGLTAALELRRYGLSVRVVDGLPEPWSQARAASLWSRTLELVSRGHPGLLGDLLESSHRLHGTSLYAEGRRLAHLSMDELPSPFPYVITLESGRLERLLSTRLQATGVEVESGRELLRFSQDAGGVTAILQGTEGEESVRAACLLGCAGPHSPVRNGLGLEFGEPDRPERWLLAELELEGPVPRDEVSVFLAPEGLLALYPLPSGRVRMACDLGPEGPDQVPGTEELQVLLDDRLLPGWRARAPVWSELVRPGERLLPSFQQGRVFLLGDAAHLHGPAGGQGLNTGLQDAFNLGWKLGWVGQGKAPPRLLDTYTAERRQVAEQVLKGCEAATRVATLRHPAAQFVRNHLARFLASQEVVWHRLSQGMVELGVHYRNSPLSQERRGDVTAWTALAPGVRPGERIPDAELLGADGSPTRLYRLLSGGGSHLLLLTGVNPSPQGQDWFALIERELAGRFGDVVTPLRIGSGGWFDPERTLHRALGALDETCYWVRPDLYVGFRCQPADLRSLSEYLGEWLQVRAGEPAPEVN